jgi:hypothetical protein
MIKGSNCSISGKKYELNVYNIVSNCILNDIRFNTQNICELAGCNSKIDIECNYLKDKDIGIEIKKSNAPDWMQCSLKYENNKWIGSLSNKIPDNAKKIFENLIYDIKLFNGHIPPFIEKNITHDEWINVKKETNNFNDIYIDCPNNTINNLYREKGCQYIQISNKGLYHLGNDICNFNVPEFICEQVLRIRTKIHTRKNINGYCKLSVIIACKPKNIKNLVNSNYSLDSFDKLPINLLKV